MSYLDLIGPSPDGLGTYYRLPFDSSAPWYLGNGNHDDPNPVHRHGTDQYYSFDFVAPEDSPVRAARGGIVRYVVDDAWTADAGVWPHPHLFHHQVVPFVRPNGTPELGNGNHLVIEHMDGTLGCYNHLRCGGIAVRVGEYVSRGQYLGHCGTTGQSSEPHLHFDVHGSFTPPDVWDDTQLAYFADGAHEPGWRPVTSDTLAPDSPDTASEFCALFEAAGDSRWVSGVSFAELNGVRLHLAASTLPWPPAGGFSPDTMVMTGFDSYHRTFVDGVGLGIRSEVRRLTAGTFAPGSEEQDLVWDLSLDHFKKEIDKQAPLVLQDVVVYREGAETLFAGLFGTGDQRTFVPGLDWDGLWQTWLDQGKLNNAMLRFASYVEDGTRKYAAIFGPGALGQSLYKEIPRKDMIATWRTLQGSGQGIVDFIRTGYGDGEAFTVLFGSQAKPGQSFIGPLPYDDLVEHARGAVAQGQQMVSLFVQTAP